MPHPTIIPPSILPGVVYQLEGDSGPQSFALPVTLSHPSTTTATSKWQIIKPVGAPDFQADSPTDYEGSSIVSSSGAVSFAPGETYQSVAITVVGDTTPEPDEYIVVKFSDPTLSFVGGYWGIGFAEIGNDDVL